MNFIQHGLRSLSILCFSILIVMCFTKLEIFSWNVFLVSLCNITRICAYWFISPRDKNIVGKYSNSWKYCIPKYCTEYRKFWWPKNKIYRLNTPSKTKPKIIQGIFRYAEIDTIHILQFTKWPNKTMCNSRFFYSVLIDTLRVIITVSVRSDWPRAIIVRQRI